MENMNQIIINRNSQKAISSEYKKIAKKRIIFFLVAIIAFKDAKGNLFERGSLIAACRKYIFLINTKASTLRPYVSNIKCYYGLNNKSFKRSYIFIDLIELTKDSSRDELIQIINKINQINDDENCLDYVRSSFNVLF